MSKNFTAIKVLCLCFWLYFFSCTLFLFRLSSEKKRNCTSRCAGCAESFIHSKHKLGFNLNGITWRNNLRFSCRPNDVVVFVVAALPATEEALPATTGDQAESEAGVAVAARLQACADWSGSSSSTAQQSGSTSRPATPAEERHQSILSSAHVTKIQIPDTDILYISIVRCR